MRLALLIEYDGKSYQGWQNQPAGVTLQGSIEAALSRVLQQEIKLTGSGRTDAGVHARGQVAHFDANLNLPVQRLPGAVNTKLPPDIRIIRAQAVGESFHARYSAVKRNYRYSISTQPVAIKRRFVWYSKYALDASKLDECSQVIRGEHNFTSFCAASTDTENMICAIHRSEWQHREQEHLFLIAGTRFLHHMVRMLVGTMVEIARDHWKLADMLNLLQHPTHQANTFTAPAKGLILDHVDYPEKFRLFKD